MGRFFWSDIMVEKFPSIISCFKTNKYLLLIHSKKQIIHVVWRSSLNWVQRKTNVKSFYCCSPLTAGNYMKRRCSKGEHRGTVLCCEPKDIIRNTPIIWKPDFLSQFPRGSQWMAEEMEHFPAWPKTLLNDSFGCMPQRAPEEILQLPPESGGYLL